MNAAVVLLGYAAALTWLGPRLLRRVTGAGVPPRLAVAAWLTAVAGAVGAWLAAVAALLVADIGSMWRHSALSLCLKALGVAGQIGLPRPVGSVLVVALLATGLIVTGVGGVRVARRVRWLRARSRAHASAARLIGRPTDRSGVVVVPAGQAAAYCVAGRPRAVVVTTAALDRLDEPQLAAVLAHEQAHLAGRHHDVLTVLRALAASFPGLPLFSAAADAVAVLLEMCADDVAVRRHGSRPLLGGLLALAGAPSSAPAVLGAADTAVLQRAERLLAPSRCWRHRAVPTAVIAVAVLTPVAAALACSL
ncbi:M56 family metallopeptidase [Mycobacterium sp. pUA109]|uniref:M56 family metallopeptidase n=1 Tax=Mycobacterium sp. pUA109 TaxID=3238982 RepID=UPI00351B44BB